MAEQTVDRIVREQKLPSAPCRTATEPLLPEEQTRGVSGILPPPLEQSVVEHYCQREWALHLDDVMLRRTSWHYYCKDAAAKAERVAEWMGQLLGWTKERQAAEVRRYRLATGVALNPGACTSPTPATVAVA
jgi:glycerol-3-phosphate dehydrogenase